MPTLNAKFVIEAVRTILVDPTEAANNPLENGVAAEFKASRAKFDATAAEWVTKFAQ